VSLLQAVNVVAAVIIIREASAALLKSGVVNIINPLFNLLVAYNAVRPA
jgi:hypothetical protein